MTQKPINTDDRQLIELPEDCRFESGEDLCVKRIGHVVMVFPRDKAWDIMEEAIDQFPEDFMTDRDQPSESNERPRL